MRKTKAKLAHIDLNKMPPDLDAIELRRWCIEQATRWPVEPAYSHPGIASGGGGYAPRIEVDIVARAEKLFVWVTK